MLTKMPTDVAYTCRYFSISRYHSASSILYLIFEKCQWKRLTPAFLLKQIVVFFAWVSGICLLIEVRFLPDFKILRVPPKRSVNKIRAKSTCKRSSVNMWTVCFLSGLLPINEISGFYSTENVRSNISKSTTLNVMLPAPDKTLLTVFSLFV